MYRQGDVLIVPIGEIPHDIELLQSEAIGVVLARGEFTGHAHIVRDQRAALFRDPNLWTLFMQVSGTDPVLLEHEEHDGILIPPGNYRIVRQREYIPRSMRQVMD
jgi:hypothetical protein